MKKATIVCAVLLLCLILPVAAAGTSKTVDVNTDMSIVINGTQLVPKNAQGIAVDVLEYQGTTYAPVRAVGEALGGTVSYDSATRTAYITKASSGGVDVNDDLALISMYKTIGDMAGHLDWLQMVLFSFLNDAFISGEGDTIIGFIQSEELSNTIGSYIEQLNLLSGAVESYEVASTNTDEFQYLEECVNQLGIGINAYIDAATALNTFVISGDGASYDSFEENCATVQEVSNTVEGFAFERWQRLFDAMTAKLS